MTSPGRAPAAFATSVRDRLKAEAKRRGHLVNELEREFVLQRFLARVFADSESPWVLKGGTGLGQVHGGGVRLRPCDLRCAQALRA